MTYEPKHLDRWTLPPCCVGKTWPDYYRAGFGRSRDSDILEESNFAAACWALMPAGETETVFIVRESHWAVGWVEWIAIHESDAAALEKADELHEAHDNYPILDETDFSDREYEACRHLWDEMTTCERIDYAKHVRSRMWWHAQTPVWQLARLSYHDLSDHPHPLATEVADYIRDTIR